MQRRHIPAPSSVSPRERSPMSEPAQAAGRTVHGACRTTDPYIDDEGPMDHPYFLVRKVGDGVETRGQPTAGFGHQIPSTSHDVADGVFAHWHWDGTRLVVRNDRYGFYPLFWFRLPGGGVCISPSLGTLLQLGAPTALDVDALAVFFSLGNFVGDDTPFSSIRTVPPNAVFVWEDGKLECRGRYPATPVAATLSRDEAIDRYIDLFARAMAKRAPDTENFAVTISGGRDSRHILLELHRTGFRPRVCVTANDNPPDPNQDPEVAALLCNELQFDHVIIDQQLSRLSAERRKNRETHFCASAHGWYLALADFLNGRFACLYDGIGGDVLSQGLTLAPDLDRAFRSQNVPAICDALMTQRRTGQLGIGGLLKGELKAALDPGVARARLATEVEKHLGGPNPTGAFTFWNRTRRQIALAPYSMLSGIPQVHAPYLDHDLFDFLSSLPASMMMSHTFHTETIVRAYPDFAHIPYASKTAPPTDDRKVRAQFLSEAARLFLVKRPSRLMKNLRPRARMLAGVLSLGHVNPWVPPAIVYVDQLESILREKRDFPIE